MSGQQHTETRAETRVGARAKAAGAAVLGARPGVTLAGGVLLLILLAAAVPEALTSTGPTDTDPLNALRGPDGSHWFGTDQLGRDVFARVVHGTRYSLAIGAAATGAGVALAVVWGLAAALSGRWGDALLTRFADVLLALPGLLLALLVILIAGKGVAGTTTAVAVGTAPGLARVVRAQALVVRRSGYVESAVALGVPRALIVVRHVLPNTLGPVVVLATVTLGASISTGAALSYLGLGAQPPTPEWGAMLTEGQGFLDQAWWIALFPGLLLLTTVLAVTVVGRHLQTHAERRAAS